MENKPLTPGSATSSPESGPTRKDRRSSIGSPAASPRRPETVEDMSFPRRWAEWQTRLLSWQRIQGVPVRRTRSLLSSLSISIRETICAKLHASLRRSLSRHFHAPIGPCGHHPDQSTPLSPDQARLQSEALQRRFSAILLRQSTVPAVEWDREFPEHPFQDFATPTAGNQARPEDLERAYRKVTAHLPQIPAAKAPDCMFMAALDPSLR